MDILMTVFQVNVFNVAQNVPHALTVLIFVLNAIVKFLQKNKKTLLFFT
jgi:hypothetical protein